MRILVAATFAGLLVAAAADAQDPTPEVLTDVYACADVDDPTARLACFDSAVSQLKSAQNAGQVVTLDTARAREVEREAFGFNVPSLPKLFGLDGAGGAGDESGLTEEEREQRRELNERLDNLEFPIRRIATRPDGKNKRFYLENGQVWRQIDGRVLRLRSDGPHVAHIRRASLDSFMMQIDGQGREVRVKREE